MSIELCITLLAYKEHNSDIISHRRFMSGGFPLYCSFPLTCSTHNRRLHVKGTKLNSTTNMEHEVQASKFIIITIYHVKELCTVCSNSIEN